MLLLNRVIIGVYERGVVIVLDYALIDALLAPGPDIRRLIYLFKAPSSHPPISRQCLG